MYSPPGGRAIQRFEVWEKPYLAAARIYFGAAIVTGMHAMSSDASGLACVRA